MQLYTYKHIFMKYQFSFYQADHAIVAIIFLVIISFCSFWFLFMSPRLKLLFYKKYPGDKGIIKHILQLKFAGFLMLGIIPVSIFLFFFPAHNLTSIGIAYNMATSNKSITWIIGVGVPIILVMWFACRIKKGVNIYPQIRVHEWDARLIIRYSIYCIFFIAGYEMLFRGLLLFPLANKFGVWPAIAINTLFYVGSHIPKGRGETFVALFFGPLLCLITLQTGTIWAAIFIHSILVISNNMFALKYNPEFVVVKRRIPVSASQCEMGCKCDTF